jgi:hypothetical protein
MNKQSHRKLEKLATSYRIRLVVSMVTTVMIVVNCGASSGLFVSGGNTPLFRIRRSSFAEVRVFPIFIVMQLHPDNENLAPQQEDLAKNRVLWKIAFDPKSAKTTSEEIETIEYGKIPLGFIQELPAQGLPEDLQENQIYEAVGPLSLMSNAAARFKIIDGKVVNIVMP